VSWHDVIHWFIDSKPAFETLSILVSVATAVLLAFLAVKANSIAKSQLDLASIETDRNARRISDQTRTALLENYILVMKAHGIIEREGMFNRESVYLLRQARDQARLMLPKDIADYTERRFSESLPLMIKWYAKVFSEQTGALIEDVDRNDTIDENAKLLDDILNDKIYELYAKHLKELK
jgi:hypothetical protein